MTKPKNYDVELDVNSLFIDPKEKKLAKELLKRYLRDYTVETISDKNTLKQIIYFEVNHLRLQEHVNRFNEESKVVPMQLQKGMIENSNQILTLKNQLGLGNKEESDSFKAMELLKKKFKIWKDENNGSRNMLCPHCGKMTLLKIKMDCWDTVKHPFFKDRVLANKKLLQMYKEGRISKVEFSEVLECSTDYIDFILKKIPC